MLSSNERIPGDYDLNSSTTSAHEETIQSELLKPLDGNEQYTSGKPRRIIIRALITHD
jgi:hypothetical protein